MPTAPRCGRLLPTNDVIGHHHRDSQLGRTNRALAVGIGLLSAEVDIYRTIDPSPRRGAGLENGEL